MKNEHQHIYVDDRGKTRVVTVNKEPSMTRQEFAAECDINNIMKKYESTGQFMHLTSKQGMYADFSEISDYQTMLETVRYADSAFAALPAEVRKRFGNNPGNLIDFLKDEKNYDEGVSLGILQKRPDKKAEGQPLPDNDEQIKSTTKKAAKNPAE